jgi:hypothetical protein
MVTDFNLIGSSAQDHHTFGIFLKFVVEEANQQTT